MKYTIYKLSTSKPQCWFKFYKDFNSLIEMIRMVNSLENLYLYDCKLNNRKPHLKQYLKKFKVIINNNHNLELPLVE